MNWVWVMEVIVSDQVPPALQLLLPAVSGHSPTVLSRGKSSMCKWPWKMACSMRAVPSEAKVAHCGQSVRRVYLCSPFGWSRLPSDCLPVLYSERCLHFLSGSQEAKEAPKYRPTLLNGNNNMFCVSTSFSLQQCQNAWLSLMKAHDVSLR